MLKALTIREEILDSYNRHLHSFMPVIDTSSLTRRLLAVESMSFAECRSKFLALQQYSMYHDGPADPPGDINQAGK